MTQVTIPVTVDVPTVKGDKGDTGPVGPPGPPGADLSAELAALTARVEALEDAATLPPITPPVIPPVIPPAPATFNSWLGNSGIPGKSVPHDVQGGIVDGARIGVNAPWVESGYCASVWSAGVLVGQFGDLIGWGRSGGKAIALSGDFAYVAMHQDNTANQGQPSGGSWGIRRYKISTGADAGFAPTRDQGGTNGVNGSVRWTSQEPVTMTADTAKVYVWYANGSTGVFDLNLTASSGTLPTRPPQIPAGVTITAANTPAITNGGVTVRGDCFVDGFVLDPADEKVGYTAKHRFAVDHVTGAVAWQDCIVVDAGDIRRSGVNGHPAVTPVRKVGNLLFVSGMNGGLQVVDLTTKKIIGTVSVPWAFDVASDGRIFSCQPGGQTQVRTSWSAPAANVSTVTGFSQVERMLVCDDGRILITGWPSAAPTWGMAGTKATLYGASQVWSANLNPYTNSDGVKAVATAGAYWSTCDLGRDNQPTVRVYRLSDGVKVDEWKPLKPHGWMDCINGLRMFKLTDGRYLFTVEDDGEARVRTYWRTYP